MRHFRFIDLVALAAVGLSLPAHSAVVAANTPAVVRKDFATLLADLKANPNDAALREQLIKMARDARPQPAVPEEAIRNVGMALFIFRTAKSPLDYVQSALAYEQAVAAAPWMVNYYHDLCVIYEKAGRYLDAKRNCEFALAGARDPQLNGQLRERLAGLELGVQRVGPADDPQVAGGPTNAPLTVAAAAVAPLVVDRFGNQGCADCPEMVILPTGEFKLGGTRQVSFKRTLALSKTELTFAQWDACVVDGGCNYMPDDKGWGRGKQPVMNVSWDDAKKYVVWLAKKTGKPYRLPSEAEWEYAASAGTSTKFFWGDSEANVCVYAAVDHGGDACGAGRPPPVGSRKPNAWGLYDLLGSMWEWTEDCWNADFESAPPDGSARESGLCIQRVERGGSWISEPEDARVGSRVRDATGYRTFYTGFRVALTL